nr:immunoglobulin heavy chain junction region [Macaca mulatta]
CARLGSSNWAFDFW